MFTLYWDTNPIDMNTRKGEVNIQGNFNKKANASVVMLGMGKSEQQIEEEAKNVSGANAVERLKKTDLSLENFVIHLKAKLVPRKARTSIGTWYVDPPILFALTSTRGVTFRMAVSKTFKGSSPVFSFIISSAW